MSTVTCVRRIQFCAGHRVAKHESKCAHLHGHNYVLYVHAEAFALDDVGRVIDFSCLKERIGGWIDRNWDHGFILNCEDVSGIHLLTQFQTESGDKQKLYLLDANPTAENMAAILLRTICPVLMEGTGVDIVKVVLWETENCYAEVSLR